MTRCRRRTEDNWVMLTNEPTLMNSNLPTTSITITEHTVYSAPWRIDSFIQEWGYYYQPWHSDITKWSRPYHFTHNFKELLELRAGTVKLKSDKAEWETRRVSFWLSLRNEERSGNFTMLKTIKIPELETVKKKSIWCSVRAGGRLNCKVFGITSLVFYFISSLFSLLCSSRHVLM